jgi:hypothetical protein
VGSTATSLACSATTCGNGVPMMLS